MITMYETGKLLKGATTAALAASVLLGGLGMAHAQMSVGATPLKTVLEINPGETQTFEIKAINRNETPLSYQVDVQMAEADGEMGNASFRPATEEDEWAVPHWVTVQNPRLTVPAREMAPVRFEIAIPADTPPGGYYGMVLFAPADLGAAEGNVAIVGQIGTPVLVKVRGEINEHTAVDNFDLDYANLKDGEPIPFSMRFLNEGNVHVMPKGRIELFHNGEQLREVATIRKEDGTMEVVDYVPINPGNGYILPGKPRVYNPKWESNTLYGDITARYSLEYGKEKISQLEGEASFSITKDMEITSFTFDRSAEEFVMTLKNTGVVQMPLRGQINIYSNAGGDPRVTISFPTNEEPSFLKGGEEKEIRVPWTGLSVLAPSDTNQFHAILSYVVDENNNEVKTARAELPHGDWYGAAFDLNTMLPYIIIGLLMLIIAMLMLYKKRPNQNQTYNNTPTPQA